MTGQGHASVSSDLGTARVEVRTINSRGFKFSPRISESLGLLESKIESLARSMIHRGTVQLSVSWQRGELQDVSQINTEVLQAYVDQLGPIREANRNQTITIDLAGLLQLPGVISATSDDTRQHEALWELVRSAIVAAIENLNEMRTIEGGRMAASLHTDCALITGHLERIKTLVPQATETYRGRIDAKVRRILEQHEAKVSEVDLLREVQIYADRVDVSEETTRLESHLQMFLDVLHGESLADEQQQRPVPTGRKLDFVIQEMVRETNTIGSKASDAEISAEVVEIKCAIERMRELVQNLE